MKCSLCVLYLGQWLSVRNVLVHWDQPGPIPLSYPPCRLPLQTMLALKMRNIFYSVNLIFFKVEAESVRIIVKAENSGLSGREPGEGHLSSSLGAFIGSQNWSWSPFFSAKGTAKYLAQWLRWDSMVSLNWLTRRESQDIRLVQKLWWTGRGRSRPRNTSWPSAS